MISPTVPNTKTYNTQTHLDMHACTHEHTLPQLLGRLGEEGGGEGCVPEQPERYLMSQNASGFVPGSEHFQTSSWIQNPAAPLGTWHPQQCS